MTETENPTVSPTCEHIETFVVAPTFCGEPTAFWYPAQGGGTMALCRQHAIPLLPMRGSGLREYAELAL